MVLESLTTPLGRLLGRKAPSQAGIIGKPRLLLKLPPFAVV